MKIILFAFAISKLLSHSNNFDDLFDSSNFTSSKPKPPVPDPFEAILRNLKPQPPAFSDQEKPRSTQKPETEPFPTPLNKPAKQDPPSLSKNPTDTDLKAYLAWLQGIYSSRIATQKPQSPFPSFAPPVQESMESDNLSEETNDKSPEPTNPAPTMVM